MRKTKILVVDDEAAFTRLLKLNLEGTNGYHVRIENRPEDALRTARDFRPELVLLDFVMPRMIGGEVAERLRSDSGLKTTPIVFLSAAVGRTWVEDHQGRVGGFPCIAKPATVEEVIDCIERQLALKEAETARGHRPQTPVPDTEPGRRTPALDFDIRDALAVIP